MDKKIDEKKLAAAKEKLACKIEPAKFMEAGAAPADESTHKSAPSAAANDFIGPDGRVYLTRMTSAGG